MRTGRLVNLVHDAFAPPNTPTPMRGELAAPIAVNGELWGVIGVGWRHGEPTDSQAEQRITRIAALVSLAVSSAEAREQLSRLASTDHLTGLHNQRAFAEHLEAAVARARRHERPLSLVVLDLDHFKLVNDTHGHQAGNRALAEFARRLKAIRRTGEILARIGGEEFAWILPDTDANAALAAAERARRAIADTPFPHIGTLTTCAGVCALRDAEDDRELFRHADLALYWAKSNGRNITIRYRPGDHGLVTADEQAGRLQSARTLAAVRALAAAIDAKQPATRHHSQRVAELCERLARAAHWPAERVALLSEAALVHDVGKIAVSEELLLRSGPLTNHEYEQIKAHPALGAQMLSGLLSSVQTVWVRQHHERHDGLGYPDRSAGPAFLEGSRLLALADAWDAMTAACTYSTPRPTHQALHEVERCAGTQFCPHAVELLSTIITDDPRG
jgi:diguanylate cyclase (GGDEF)-like protein